MEMKRAKIGMEVEEKHRYGRGQEKKWNGERRMNKKGRNRSGMCGGKDVQQGQCEQLSHKAGSEFTQKTDIQIALCNARTFQHTGSTLCCPVEMHWVIILSKMH